MPPLRRCPISSPPVRRVAAGLLMGIFRSCWWRCHRAAAASSQAGERALQVLICLSGCAAMAALYWFAGGGSPRSWLAAGWAVILLLLLLTWATWKGQPVRNCHHPPPQPRSRRHNKPRSRARSSHTARAGAAYGRAGRIAAGSACWVVFSRLSLSAPRTSTSCC